MFRYLGHDGGCRGGIGRIMLADDDKFSRAAHGQAAVAPNSGTASFNTALMVTKSSLSMARSSPAIHLRSVCIGGSLGLAALTPATPTSTRGRLVGTRVSLV